MFQQKNSLVKKLRYLNLWGLPAIGGYVLKSGGCYCDLLQGLHA